MKLRKYILLPCIILVLAITAGCSELLRGFESLRITPTDYTPAFELESSIDKEVLQGWQIYENVAPSMVSVLNETKSSEGSGIIMSADGYIITNAHVIKGASTVKIVLLDGTIYTAQSGSFWYDEFTDIGVVKIDAQQLPPATFGDADEIKIGEDVYAIGNPGGMEFSHSITKGIVSYKYRKYSPIPDSGYTVNCLQIDAAINPGNSGGALINVYGQVIGINSAKIADVNFESMGFAITINDARPIVSDLIEYKKVKGRPAIGITYMFNDSPRGAFVVSVNDNSNLKGIVYPNDVITEINGVALTDQTKIAQSLKGKKSGDTITIKYKKCKNYYISGGNYVYTYHDEIFEAEFELIEM
jgi:serine protease Do